MPAVQRFRFLKPQFHSEIAEIKQIAHYTTKALAGQGAIRETVELIFKSKGIWEQMIDKARA